jgi:hypothetical protein
MPMYFCQWSQLTVDHLAEYDVTPDDFEFDDFEFDDFEFVVQNPESTGFSRSSGRPFAVAITDDGRELLCVYEFIDEMTIEPIIGYELH